jgi:hypothetical protein
LKDHLSWCLDHFVIVDLEVVSVSRWASGEMFNRFNYVLPDHSSRITRRRTSQNDLPFKSGIGVDEVLDGL